MLFGKILKQSTSYAFNPDILDTEDVGPVLSINNIALGHQNQSQTSLWVKKNGEQFLIANLNKDKPHASIEINLFIQDEAELFVKGQGTIHLVGSFEPGEQPFDSQNLYDNEDISSDQQQQLLNQQDEQDEQDKQDKQDKQEDDQSSQEVAAPLSKNVIHKSKQLKHVSSNQKKTPSTIIQNNKKSPPIKSASSKLQTNDDKDSDDIGSLNSFIDDQDIIDDIEIDDSISDEDLPTYLSKSSKNSIIKQITKTQNKPFNKSLSQGNKNNQNKIKSFKKH